MIQICYHDRKSDTLVLAHTGWLPEAVALPKDRWETVSLPRGSPAATRSWMMKNACERSKEKICDRKARRKPRSVRRDCAQRLPISVPLAEECEQFSCISGWCACTHAYPVSAVPHESSQRRRRRYSVAISLINATVSAATLGL
jgi:hypothetical protein